MVCPEIKHVSMRLCSYIPTACEMAEKVVGLLYGLGTEQVGFVHQTCTKCRSPLEVCLFLRKAGQICVKKVACPTSLHLAEGLS